MARLRLMALLLIAMLVITACGGSSSTAQPTAAPAGGATNAPAAEQPTAAPAPSAAPAPTAASAAEEPTAAAEEPTAAAEQPTAPPAPAAEQATAAPAAELEVDKSKLSAELHFYNWTDYIDPDILTAFEQEYGVKVIMDLYDANEDMIAKVRSGNSGYDIVVPSDYAVDTMIQEKLLAPIDKALLPNLANLKKQNLDLYYDKGNTYSVPYFFGISGLAYNKSKITTAPDSWSALFDPAQIEKYKGEFSMLDDQRETPGAALKYIGKSLNDTDPAALKQVEDILKAQKPFLAAYNSSDVNRKLASGEYVIAHCWSGAALQARNGLGSDFEGNPDIVFVMPKEGGMIWQDNLAILADSPNSYTAHVFINYLLGAEVAAKNTEYVGYLTPNAAGEAQLSPEIQALYKEGFAPDEEMYKRLEWAVRNDKTTVFDELWTKLKGE
jgi:spermidine/putrescine transport system substrate-binding protein